MFFLDNIITIITIILMVVAWWLFYGKKFFQNLKENPYFENDASQAFASLGVLGTFIGITFGLLFFDTHNLEKSVPALLDGMKSAFFTSIVGMAGSLGTKWWQRKKQKEYDLSQPLDEVDENATIATLIEYLQEKNIETTKFNTQLIQTLQEQNIHNTNYHEEKIKSDKHLLDAINTMSKSISGESDTTLLSQLKNLRIAIIDEEKETRSEIQLMREGMISAFNEFAHQMAENNSKAFIKALEETIKDFNTKIQEQFGENFKQLNIAVGKLLVWQEEYKNTIVEVTENQKVIFEGIEQAKSSLKDMANNSYSIQESAQLLSNIILTAQKYQEELLISLNTLVEISKEAKQFIPALNETLTQATNNITMSSSLAHEQIAKLHNLAQENMTKSIQETTELAQKAIQNIDYYLATTQNSINKTSEQISSLSNKATESIDQYLGNVVNNLEHHDTILQQSFNATNKAIENTTSTLEKNVTDFHKDLKNKLDDVNIKFKDNLNDLNNKTNHIIEKQINVMNENIEKISISAIEKLDKDIQNMLKRLKDISDNMIKMINTHESELNNAFDKTNRAISASTDKLERSALEVTQNISDRLVEMNKQNTEALRKTTENVNKNLEDVMGESMKQFANQLALISNKFAQDYTPLAEKLREVVQISRRIS
ncbi:hypothetical protein [uncultured Megamonas sp.]|uniref:hypothetical protein n=1 Tax=uncultured Megamonas sp. TaxID=286140 RepID=UPI002596F6CC|nr:hypothetical protein [uncultured Megamonas sp.]